MVAQEMNFHTAVAGFHRGQVLDYIRQMTRQQEKAEAQIADLQQQLEQARDQIARQEAEQPLQSKLDTLTLDNSTLQLTCASLQEELAGLQQQVQQPTQANSALEQENALLTQQLAAWEPNVNSYDILCQTVGEIEVAARARSAAILSEARQQEQDLYNRAEATLRRAEGSFCQARNGADATLAHVITELDRLRSELYALGGILDDSQNALSAIHVRQATGEVDSHE